MNLYQSIQSNITIFCIRAFIVVLFSTALANLNAEEKLPYIQPPDPKTNALSYILIDADSKQILAEKAAYEKRFPASLTKLMTSYVAFNEIRAGNISLDDEVYISEKAWKTGGSRSFIKVNTKMRLEDLIKAMIVQSGNDSAVAIAEHIAGDEETFAQLMNLYAQKLKMNQSSFANASGLPDEKEYTTAHDMAILASAIINQFPLYYQWYSIKELEINGIKQLNRNKLLWRDDEIDGMKTGHTTEAGYNLVASAVQDDMRLVAVVMKADTVNGRETDAYKLLNYGFRFYQTSRIFEPETPIHSLNLKGFESEILVGVKNSVFLTIAKNRDELLEYEYLIEPNLIAPIKSGDLMGEILIRFNDKELLRESIYALNDVKKASLIQRITNWFKSLI